LFNLPFGTVIDFKQIVCINTEIIMIVLNHLFKNRVPLLESALDAYTLRQKTIAKNIANVNTPNYVPERVRFEELLDGSKDSLRNNLTSSGHLDSNGRTVKASVEDAPYNEAEVYHSGETHVNVDTEMGELARNQIRMRFATQMISKYFKGLNSAITGQASNS
jgi:flagellar basal-body rod protein FlgB